MSEASWPAIRATCITLLVLTTAVMLARLVGDARRWRARQVQSEDGWLALCYGFFVAVAALYLRVVPAYLRVESVEIGRTAPYATVLVDARFIQQGVFSASVCIWLCLWSAKLSLLCVCRKLLDKLPLYRKLWWALVGFSTATLVGCIVSLCVSCETMTAWFTVGGCSTRRDVARAVVSMWYSYAVDVLTDLLIMALPLRLIAGLQMPFFRKLSIAVLFGLGCVCIVASTIRVTQINNGANHPTPTWLALWGTVEAATAVVIVNSPGLYRIAKQSSARRNRRRRGGGGGDGDVGGGSSSYYGHSYSFGSKTPRSQTKRLGTGTEDRECTSLQNRPDFGTVTTTVTATVTEDGDGESDHDGSVDHIDRDNDLPDNVPLRPPPSVSRPRRSHSIIAAVAAAALWLDGPRKSQEVLVDGADHSLGIGHGHSRGIIVTNTVQVSHGPETSHYEV
ncbi:hypothetical protein CMQ_4586 [Grosmannia clavigera kw1407]|uniref:Rhodopsin domain-containing protein n=1 Tax=Grosmannia clavigera (strain kw1407 / UAMH 11150) TaxID=655863 RepID=F0XTT9_GROCL|nr:uncharacterized protein CMQ_4586 [Grosmannia clavigera kw1407]EFW98734.1 hypothetical protein CMQ_4586 [Grosmannia clavigera kw1407]